MLFRSIDGPCPLGWRRYSDRELSVEFLDESTISWGKWSSEHAPSILTEPFIRNTEADALLGADPSSVQRVGSLDILFLISWRLAGLLLKHKQRLWLRSGASCFGSLGFELASVRIESLRQIQTYESVQSRRLLFLDLALRKLLSLAGMLVFLHGFFCIGEELLEVRRD